MHRHTLAAVIWILICYLLLPVGAAWSAPVTEFMNGADFMSKLPQVAVEKNVAAGDRISDGDIAIWPGEVVQGNVVAMNGDVIVDGKVMGNVTAISGDVILHPSAYVQGNVTAMRGKIIHQPGATVKGREVSGGQWSYSPGAETNTNVSFAFNLWHWFLYLLGLVALAAVAAALFPGHLAAMSNGLRAEPWRFLGTGFLGWIVLPLVLLALAITIIGIPVAIMGVLLLPLVVLTGAILLGLIIGQQVERALEKRWPRFSGQAPLVQVTVGVALLWLAQSLPGAGFLIWPLAAIIGLGALLVTRFGTNRPWFNRRGPGGGSKSPTENDDSKHTAPELKDAEQNLPVHSPDKNSAQEQPHHSPEDTGPLAPDDSQPGGKSSGGKLLGLAILALIFSASLLLGPGPAHAQGMSAVGQGINVPAGRTADGVMSVGGPVNIDGRVTGGLASVGGPVRINGQVEDSVAVIGGPLLVSGLVQGDAAVVGGSLEVSGTISGSLAIVGGTVHLLPTARVNGDLVLVGGRVDRDPGAKVAGQDVNINGNEFITRELGRWFGGYPWPGPFTAVFWWRWISLILLLVLLLLINVFFPAVAGQVAKEVTVRPGRSLLWGLGVMILALPVTLLMVITVLGIPLAGLLWIALACAYLLGLAGLTRALGHKILTAAGVLEPASHLAILIGVLILSLVSWVPYAGLLIGILFKAAGLGAVVSLVPGWWHRKS